MKNLLILSLLALNTACHTYNRAPYSGGLGEYGFTYDLEAAPSPFVDTSYRPLSPFDLAAPIIITVTNQAPPRIIYQTGPEIGVTRYSGSAPAIAGAAPYSGAINEAAGARNEPEPTTPGYGAAPGPAYYGAPAYFLDGSTNGTGTNTNALAFNTNVTSTITNNVSVTITNINGTNFVFNGTNFVVFNGTNFSSGGTNFSRTNGVINEAAGARSTDNPATQFPGPQPIQSRSNNTFNVTNSVAPPQRAFGTPPANTTPSQAPNPPQNAPQSFQAPQPAPPPAQNQTPVAQPNRANPLAAPTPTPPPAPPAQSNP